MWILGIMSDVKYACSGAFTIEYPSLYYLKSCDCSIRVFNFKVGVYFIGVF